MEKDEVVAVVLNPLAEDGVTESHGNQSKDLGGILFSRNTDRFARPGRIVAKVAGREPLREESGPSSYILTAHAFSRTSTTKIPRTGFFYISTPLADSNTHNGLFITDLDGTLLTDEKRVSSDDRACLEILRENGIRTAIATGRSLYSFNRLLSSSQFSADTPFPEVDYLIFSTGAGILDFSTGRIIQSFSLNIGEVMDIAGYLECLGVNYMIHAPIPDTNHFFFRKNNNPSPDFDTRVSMYNQYGTPLADLSLDEISRFTGATEVLCIVDCENGHKTASRISGHLRQYSVIKATSPLDATSIWIEIFAAGVCKSGSAEWLSSFLKIRSCDICAVGNDYNDEDLLCWAGTGYVVENAPASLKNSFPTVPSNNNGGITGAIIDWMEKRNYQENGLPDSMV